MWRRFLGDADSQEVKKTEVGHGHFFSTTPQGEMFKVFFLDYVVDELAQAGTRFWG